MTTSGRDQNGRYRRTQPLERATPDVNVFLVSFMAVLTATVCCHLAAEAATDVPQWSIIGIITILVDDDDKTQNASYLQVLDDKGKVIARFSRQQITWPSDYRLLFNGQLITQRNQTDMRALTMFAQPFTISMKDGKVTFQTATYRPFQPLPLTLPAT